MSGPGASQCARSRDVWTGSKSAATVRAAAACPATPTRSPDQPTRSLPPCGSGAARLSAVESRIMWVIAATPMASIAEAMTSLGRCHLKARVATPVSATAVRPVRATNRRGAGLVTSVTAAATPATAATWPLGRLFAALSRSVGRSRSAFSAMAARTVPRAVDVEATAAAAPLATNARTPSAAR